MDSQFWIKAWKEGRTAFHQDKVHGKLVEFFSLLGAEGGQKILVPLCGKTKDLIWLQDQHLHVHGVELYEEAVKAFFTENNLSPVTVSKTPDFSEYKYRDIHICQGDFFKLQGPETFDLVYDRASLVALPESMRKDYAQVITRVLKKKGKYLLIVYDYDQSKMDGPPFSVKENEIYSLYEKAFSIKLLDMQPALQEGSRLSAMGDGIKQNVFLLEKK